MMAGDFHFRHLMKTPQATCAVLALLSLSLTPLLAQEVSPERQKLLREVDEAWKAVENTEPLIGNIEFPGGTVFEYLQKVQASLVEPQTAPLVVAVPPAVLSNMSMPSVSIKNMPLSFAVGKLSGTASAARLVVSFQRGVWWIQEAEDDLVTRTFDMAAAELQALGLVPQGHKVELGGKAWPAELGASATYQGTKFVVRASPKTMKRLDAVLMLRAEGYKDLRLEP